LKARRGSYVYGEQAQYTNSTPRDTTPLSRLRRDSLVPGPLSHWPFRKSTRYVFFFPSGPRII
jgi:hypothetical protein